MLYAHSVNQDLHDFYQLTRRTRNGVLDWLETLPPEVFTAERDDFAYGSLRTIFAHVADCYLHWVSSVGFGRAENDVQVNSAKDLRAAFLRVDATVQEALLGWGDWDEPFTYTSPRNWTDTFTRRWLILHPITHEFHHKGQALALARVLGYPHPGKPDTDLVTPGGGTVSN